MIVHGIQMPAQSQLFEIAAAVEGFGFFFGSRERGQQQGSQYRNDRDDYQQLEQRESSGGGSHFWGLESGPGLSMNRGSGLRMPQYIRESGIGLPHSTTSRKEWHAVIRASVVECGPMPLFF